MPFYFNTQNEGKLVFSRRHFEIFSHFPRKQDLKFHANCLLWRQFAWHARSCFLRKKQTNINLSSAESAKCMLSVNNVKNSLAEWQTVQAHIRLLLWNNLIQKRVQDYLTGRSKFLRGPDVIKLQFWIDGQEQTVQTQIRCCRIWHLIRVYTVYHSSCNLRHIHR